MNSISRHVRSIAVPLAIFFALAAGLIIYTIWTHGRLPDKMAVHFDGSGAPNRWSGKWEMTGVMLGVALLYSVIFGVFAMYLPRMPTKFWNIPRKDYWLSPERVSQTMTDFSRDYLWMGIVMLLLMGYVQWDVFEANTARPDHHLSMSIWLVFGAMALFFGLVIKMVRKFRRVPDHS